MTAHTPPNPARGSIPLTVIGGFLGAGKTTLVNHLLRTAERRWGVLVNDFGAVNVDAALIAERDGDTIALANGCVCCSMGEDLGEALTRLAARTPAPEHVIVEASGVGDPWRIAQLALIEPGFTLEPLVVLADATAFQAQLDDRWIADTVRLQLRHAEILLITKPEIAGASKSGAVAAELARLRPGAPILPITDGAVPADALSFPVDPLARPRPSRLRADLVPHPFRTWHWQPEAAIDPCRLRSVLESLPAAVLRVKGICRFAPHDTPTLLQFAAQRWACTPAPDTPLTGLVLIGTPDLPPPDDLLHRFAKALAEPDAC